MNEFSSVKLRCRSHLTPPVYVIFSLTDVFSLEMLVFDDDLLLDCRLVNEGSKISDVDCFA
jgi:hypothetical protein